MTKIKASIIILSLIMIGCKDKKEDNVDYYPKTVYVDDRGNKATSWEEAESFIKQRSSTEKVVGFIPSLEPVIEERPYMSIEFCKKEFFLLDEELESFKEFLNDPTRNIYHSIDGIKIVKSEDGKLCGVGRMPRHLRT